MVTLALLAVALMSSQPAEAQAEPSVSAPREPALIDETTAAPAMDDAAAAPEPSAPAEPEPGITFASPGEAAPANAGAGPASAEAAPASAERAPPRAEVPNDTTNETHDLYRRSGSFAGLGAGVTNCSQGDCFDIVIAGNSHLEFGYRSGFIAVVAAASLGGAPLSGAIDTYDGGTALLFDVGGGLELFPVRKGPVDPFIAATLGYSRMRWRLTQGDLAAKAWYSRGAARLGAGINFYVNDFFSLGPRADLTLPFLGKLCAGNPSGYKECDSVLDLIQRERAGYDRRATRRSLARPWSVTLNLHFIFG